MRKHSWQEALRQVDEVEQRGIERDVVLHCASITSCRCSGRWEQALLDLGTVSRRCLEANVFVYGAIARACERNAAWQHVFLVLGGLIQGACEPNVVTHTVAISANGGGTGSWHTALLCFGAAGSVGIKVDLTTYSVVMGACESEGEWRLAVMALGVVHLRGLEPNVISNNAALSLCGKSGEWQQAFAALHAMQRQLCAPGVISYGAAISSRGSGVEQAVELLSEAEHNRCEVNMVAQHAAIGACRRHGEWRDALALFQGAKHKGFNLDEVTHTVATNACHLCDGVWTTAATLVRQARREALRMDVIQYNSALSACQAGSNWCLSLAALSNVDHKSIEHDATTNVLANRLCQDMARWQEALMLTGQLVYTRDALLCKLSICKREPVDWRRAFELLSEAVHRSLRPDVLALSAAAGASANGAAWYATFAMLAAFGCCGSRPDAVTHTAKSSSCIGSRHWQRALDVLRQIDLESVQPSLICYSAAASAHDCSAEWLRALCLLGQALGRQLEPDVAIISAVVSATMTCEQWVLALRILAGVRDECEPRLLGGLAWAFAQGGAGDYVLIRRIVEEASLAELSFDTVSNLVWSLATFGGAQPRLLRRLAADIEMRLRHQGALNARYATSLIRVIWSFAFAASYVAPSLKSKVLAALHRIGRALDSNRALIQIHFEVERDTRGNEPRAKVELGDRLVLFKPPDWEVDDSASPASTPLSLSDCLASCRPPRRWPIARDDARRGGFLHRLDVPSSGLVAVARTYEAYYDLLFQLNEGSMEREYLVLGRGWSPPSRSSIGARIYAPVGGDASLICSRGRLSSTWVTTLACARRC